MSVSLLAVAAVAVGITIARQRPPAKPALAGSPPQAPAAPPAEASPIAALDAIRSAGF